MFAGQRDDGFYADIQSIFDLDFGFDKPEAFDSQGGYNVHTIVLNIPMAELDGAKIAGVYATGDGRKVRLHTNFPHHRDGILKLLGCAYDREAVQAEVHSDTFLAGAWERDGCAMVHPAKAVAATG